MARDPGRPETTKSAERFSLCPKTQRTRSKVGSGMATLRRFAEKESRVINRLLDAIGGVLAVLGDVRPNVENIGFGDRSSAIEQRYAVSTQAQ
jgi:hypothetical protein